MSLWGSTGSLLGEHGEVDLKTAIISVLLSLLIITKSIAFDITFHNYEKETVLVRCYRIDHTIHNLFGPFNYATGEIKPGKEWIVRDRDGEKHMFIVERLRDGKTAEFAVGIDANMKEIWIGIGSE